MGELKSGSKLSHNNTHNKRNLNLSQISNLLYNFMRMCMIITPTNYLLLSSLSLSFFLSLSLSLQEVWVCDLSKRFCKLQTLLTITNQPCTTNLISLPQQKKSLERRRRSQLQYIEVFSHLFFLLHVLCCFFLPSLPSSLATKKRNRKAQTDRQTDRQSFGEEEGCPRQTLSRAARKWGKNTNSNLQREGEKSWVGR